MQDAIILYENGKAIGGEGHPTNASDITFDNSNTDLVSENVEGAIKEVNEKTKHGIVELWKSSSSTTFAGQTVTINTNTTILDSVLIEIEPWASESFGSELWAFDLDVLDNTIRYLIYNFNADGKLQRMIRSVTFTITSSSITLVFGDNRRDVWNTYGNSSATSEIDNTKNIPYRVLGLIHND